MNLQDYINVGQSAALSIGFLYLIWKSPAVVNAWLDNQERLAVLANQREERMQQFQADEREKDRLARHESNNVFQKVIADMFIDNKATIRELSESIRKME